MVSILSQGNTDLNEYPELLRDQKYYGINCIGQDYGFSLPDPVQGCPPGSRYYGYYPLGAAFLALPPLVAMDVVLRFAGPPLLHSFHLTPVIRTFLARDYVHALALTELVLASFLMAVTAAFVFLAARQFLSRGLAILLSLLFAYGTAAWSTGSRALWQHGPEMLMFSIALYLLLRARQRPALYAWTAVPLVFAYFVRPTGGIAVAMVGLFVLVHHRPWFLRWSLLAAITAAPFFACNLVLYHRLLPSYFTHHSFLQPALSNAGPFLSALAGQCISPSRGLFVFSPFLLFAVVGIQLSIRRHWQTPLTYYLVAILILHWIVISAFTDWTAGYCYGPRYFSDLTPIFIFFLIPVFAEYQDRRVPKLAVAAFALAALIAFGIQFRGAVNWDVERWNEDGVSPERAWDWKDPQFLRGLHR